MVNNFGGMSELEMGALTHEFLERLPSRISPIRVYSGTFQTSLNAPAFSLTLCNVTTAANIACMNVSQILEFMDMKTDTAWEAAAGSQSRGHQKKSQIVDSPLSSLQMFSGSQDLNGLPTPSPPADMILANGIEVDPTALENSLRTACNQVIAAEPELTKWDTMMGDGDCGETFKTGCQGNLNINLDCSQ